MRRFRLVLLALLVLALFGAGRGLRPRAPQTASRPGLSVWVVGDTREVRHDTLPAGHGPLWDGRTITLSAARNEVVAWQVAIRPGSPVAGGRVTIGEFTGGAGKLPADACQAFRQHFLTVKVPSQLAADKPARGVLGAGDYPNQLLPLVPADPQRGVFDAAAGQTTPLWFDLTVPEDAQPGKYTSTLTLVLGARQRVVLPVALTVEPFSLPRATHLRNWFYYGPEQVAGLYGAEQGQVVEGQMRRLAHDHRITLTSDVVVPLDRARRLSWWAEAGPWLAGQAYTSGPCRGAGASLIPIGRPAAEDPLAPDEARVKAEVRASVEFLDSVGLLSRAFLFCWDEPGTPAQYAAIRRIGTWTHEASGGRLPVMVTAPVTPTRPELGSLGSAVDIYCSDRISSAEARYLREQGRQHWVYNGGLAGMPLLDCPLAGVAAWGPAAWRFDLGGWFMWDAVHWRMQHFGVSKITDLYLDPLTFDETRRQRADGSPYPARDAMRLNGDGVFFYPGEPAGHAGVVTCLRTKAFRRGAQDHEYLWLLAQAGHRRAADAFARRLATNRFEWEGDPDVWISVRREMAALLAGGKS